MELKVTRFPKDLTLIEIFQKGEPASAQNPVKVEDLQNLDWPRGISGQKLIISGMPATVVVAIALYYKNLFNVIAIANPRNGVAEVAHSLSPRFKLGDPILLP